MLFLLLLLADPARAGRLRDVGGGRPGHRRLLPALPARPGRRPPPAGAGVASATRPSARCRKAAGPAGRPRPAAGRDRRRRTPAAAAACCPSTSPGPSRTWPTPSGLPLYGPRPDLVWLGSKSGSRQVATEAGVPVLAGAEDLFSLAELAKAVAGLREARPDAAGGGGQAQQRVLRAGQRHRRARRPGRPADRRPPPCSAPPRSRGRRSRPRSRTRAPSWRSWCARDGLRSPSVQLQISPAGDGRGAVDPRPDPGRAPRTRSTSAAASRPGPSTALAIQAEARKVAEVLAARGGDRRRSGSTSWSTDRRTGVT